ncbi:hypothetical protein ACLB1E_30795 [Escherichia coli]
MAPTAPWKKGMTPEEVEATGAQIILGNTFHLWLRPGQEIMKLHGDLPPFLCSGKNDPHRLRRLPGLQPWRYS